MKVETIEEFLARGGKITKVSTQGEIKSETMKPLTHSGMSSVMSLDDADLYYGEHKPRKTKPKRSTIDISALPEELRRKYIDGILNNDDE